QHRALAQLLQLLGEDVADNAVTGVLRLIVGEAEVTGLLCLRGRTREHEQGNRWVDGKPAEPDWSHVFPPVTNSTCAFFFRKVVTSRPLVSTWIVGRAGVPPYGCASFTESAVSLPWPQQPTGTTRVRTYRSLKGPQGQTSKPNKGSRRV